MYGRVVGRYDYRDQTGKLLYWKERIEPGRNGTKKEFRFYHGNQKLGRGGDPIPYLLPDVIRSKTVIITEGEKQADLVRSWGLCATSLDSGAGSRITPEIAEYFTGKRVAILRDNDDPGEKYALKFAVALKGKSESMRIVLLPDLPEKGDICDWNGDKKELLRIIQTTPEWIPPPDPKPRQQRSYSNNKNSKINDELIALANQYPIERLVEFQHGKTHCFNHKEKTPSMTIFKNKCRCHGACARSWSTIDVCMERDGMTFTEAVLFLTGGE